MSVPSLFSGHPGIPGLGDTNRAGPLVEMGTGLMAAARPPGSGAKKQKPKDLVPLTELRKRLLLFTERYAGIRPIAVSDIVGSVDRSSQFDRDFRPRVSAQRERARQIALRFPGGDFPPIKVFQVGEFYFVRDGHIRVAAAKQMGVEYIDAEITELTTDAEIPHDVEMIDVIHMEQNRRMLTETKLGDVRPEADLRVSLPEGYVKLRESVAGHGYRLIQERGELLTREEVALDWYERVFKPSTDALRHSGIAEAFPQSTPADLFLWLEERRRSILPLRGPVSLEDVAWEAAHEDLHSEEQQDNKEPE